MGYVATDLFLHDGFGTCLRKETQLNGMLYRVGASELSADTLAASEPRQCTKLDDYVIQRASLLVYLESRR